jgi:hypothetical protein
LDSPIRTQAANIIGRAKSSVSLINAKFQSLKIPPSANPQQSVGALFAMALAHGKTHSADSLIFESGKIRRQSKMTFVECEKSLSELRQSANHWLALSDFLKGNAQVLPIEIPEYLARAATLVKSAALSGAIPAVTLLTLVDEINRNAMTSLSYLQETTKRLTRIRSAGDVAVAAQTEHFFNRVKNHAGFTVKDQKRIQRYLPFVEHIASERRKSHAANHFSDHQLKRTYKGYELAATGVEI